MGKVAGVVAWPTTLRMAPVNPANLQGIANERITSHEEPFVVASRPMGLRPGYDGGRLNSVADDSQADSFVTVATVHVSGTHQARPAVSQLTARLNWTPNIWLGVSIESERWLERLEVPRRTGARTRFLSLEPLLGPFPGIEQVGVDWVIVGGESGPGTRLLQAGWVREILDKCLHSHVPFFSSSGDAYTRNVPADCSTAERGIRWRRRSRHHRNLKRSDRCRSASPAIAKGKAYGAGY